MQQTEEELWFYRTEVQHSYAGKVYPKNSDV